MLKRIMAVLQATARAMATAPNTANMNGKTIFTARIIAIASTATLTTILSLILLSLAPAIPIFAGERDTTPTPATDTARHLHYIPFFNSKYIAYIAV